MKTKSNKLRVSKSVATKDGVVHNRGQRILGFIALLGLFLCGLFVGMAIQTPSGETSQAIASASAQIADQNVAFNQPQDIEVCVEVERLLARRLPAATDNADDRIDRAKIYASMAERGCIENTERYAELARQELDIARAIENDEFNRDETIEVVETYKRLNMQAAAEEIFEKAKKLTNPAIDFIIQVEKIINE